MQTKKGPEIKERKLLFRAAKTERTELQVAHITCNIQGQEQTFIDIRNWYTTRTDPTLKPSKTGIWIPTALIEPILNTLSNPNNNIKEEV